MAEQGTAGETLQGDALQAQVNKEQAATAAMTAGEKGKKPSNPDPNIVRGRMPLVVVFMARFGDTKGEAVGDAAKKFGTTIGKIDDIRKNRNFAYVTKDFVPTTEQIQEGVNYFKKHPDYNSGACDPFINELEKMTPATAEQAAAFEKVRKESHGQPSTTATGETIPAGGGNRRSRKKATAAPAAEKPAAEPAKADDLLK